MRRQGTKLIITCVLAVVLTLLLANRVLKGSKQLQVDTLTGAATSPHVSDLRTGLEQSLTTAAARALVETVTASRPPRSLPRDPFAFHPSAAGQTGPQHSPHQFEQAPFLLPEEPAVEETLQLKATAIDRYGKWAFINDQVLTEGQSILGYAVVRITARHVMMTKDGKEVELRLENRGKP